MCKNLTKKEKSKLIEKKRRLNMFIKCNSNHTNSLHGFHFIESSG